MHASDFVNAIAADPADLALRLVYSDWLEEQSDARGELLRIQEDLRRIDVSDRCSKEIRMQELLRAGVEPLVIRWKNMLGMEFALVFPGEFFMGSCANQRDKWDWEFGQKDQQRRVIARPFYLGRCPVTQSAWLSLMGTRPWSDDADDGEDFPATHVNWDEAKEFCAFLTEFSLTEFPRELSTGWTYQLPSQAQWEYACRAGTTTKYCFGDDMAELEQFAWHRMAGHPFSSENDGPKLVMQKKANPWGMCDMQGNVWEWCGDWYEDIVPILRGGAWSSNAECCRSTIQNGASRRIRSDSYGFRVAIVGPPASRTEASTDSM